MTYSKICFCGRSVVMRSLSLATALLVLTAASGGHVCSGEIWPSSSQDLIPEATLPTTDEELKWWQALREAAREAITVRARKIEEIAKAKRKPGESRNNSGSSKGKAAIPPRNMAKIDSDIEITTKRFRDLVREGGEKSYRVPMPNYPPLILHKFMPADTGETVGGKAGGTVRVSIAFLAGGGLGDVKVLQGLDEQSDKKAAELVSQILFLPAVKNRRFATAKGNMEMTFNAR
jgi:hypothetical protein